MWPNTPTPSFVADFKTTTATDMLIAGYDEAITRDSCEIKWISGTSASGAITYGPDPIFEILTFGSLKFYAQGIKRLARSATQLYKKFPHLLASAGSNLTRKGLLEHLGHARLILSQKLRSVIGVSTRASVLIPRASLSTLRIPRNASAEFKDLMSRLAQAENITAVNKLLREIARSTDRPLDLWAGNMTGWVIDVGDGSVVKLATNGALEFTDEGVLASLIELQTQAGALAMLRTSSMGYRAPALQSDILKASLKNGDTLVFMYMEKVAGKSGREFAHQLSARGLKPGAIRGLLGQHHYDDLSKKLYDEGFAPDLHEGNFMVDDDYFDELIDEVAEKLNQAIKWAPPNLSLPMNLGRVWKGKPEHLVGVLQPYEGKWFASDVYQKIRKDLGSSFTGTDNEIRDLASWVYENAVRRLPSPDRTLMEKLKKALIWVDPVQ